MELKRANYLLSIHLNEVIADNGGTVSVIRGGGGRGGGSGGGAGRGLYLRRRVSRG